MHITGGLGAMHGIEGFGPDYDLPNKDTYNETCAAVGNVLFNYRMFLMTRDAKYADVAEVALFNNVLAGVNLEGNRFFYVNPLEADGETAFNHGHAGRAPWFGTACCPTNLARLIPQVSGMMYSYDNDDIYLTFYASSSTTIPMPDGQIAIQQISDYPFEGSVKIIFNPENKQRFNLKLRIPTWAQGEKFLPGDLYSFVNENHQQEWQVLINGEARNYETENGFVSIDRNWSNGDSVELVLDMNVKFNKAHELVTENQDKVAITRGPLLYCAEGGDYNSLKQSLFVEPAHDNDIKTDNITDTILKGIPSVSIPLKKAGETGTKTEMQLIPYYSWNNRGNLPMMVWINSKPLDDKN